MIHQEDKLTALSYRIRKLEEKLLEPVQELSDSARLKAVCEKFGTNPLAIRGRARSAHLCVSRHAVMRELRMSYGWSLQKISEVTHRSPRHILRVTK